MDDDWGAEAAQVWNAEAGRNINMTGFFIKKNYTTTTPVTNPISQSNNWNT